MGEWRDRKYNNGTMTLWHSSPFRFKDNILKKGILPRCALPITEKELNKTAHQLAKEIEKIHGVKPTEKAIEQAKHWARVRLDETKQCVYTSGDKEYSQANCLAGDEWHHGLSQYLLGALKDEEKLPKELNTRLASHRLFPDTKCAVFELEVPVEEAKKVPENEHDFDVYERKYDNPEVRKHFDGSDDWYRQVFVQVALNQVKPSQIKKVETYQKVK